MNSPLVVPVAAILAWLAVGAFAFSPALLAIHSVLGRATTAQILELVAYMPLPVGWANVHYRDSIPLLRLQDDTL